jgi:hypothetical protein
MNIPVQNGNLPQGFCAPDYQTLLNAFSAVQFVNLNTISGIIVSSTPPADHSQAWLQLDSSGRPVRLYFFAQGAWLSLHPDFPGKMVLYNQVLPDFTIFDGGDSNTISAVSGAMWQLAATTLDGSGTQVLQAAFPVGVGTFAVSGAVGVGAANVTTTGQLGEDRHVINTNEMAPHTHWIANTDFADTATATDLSGTTQMNQGAGGHSTDLDYKLKGSADPAILGLTSSVGAGSGHNNIPPFYGVYFFQRTNRLYYVVHP